MRSMTNGHGASFSNGQAAGSGPGYNHLKGVLVPEVLESRTTFWDLV